MDYKYIEQLLERYWNCETSIEEEQILNAFFHQKDLPAHLEMYRSLFCYQSHMKNEFRLSDDFETRIMAEIERPVVKARRLSLVSRFMPMFKAAAMLILILTVGGVVKHSVGVPGQPITTSQYDQLMQKNDDPQMAYEADSMKTMLKQNSKIQHQDQQ